MCRSKDRKDKLPNSAVVFDTLCNVFDDACTINDFSLERSLCLEHHVYYKLNDSWVRQKSKDHPFLNVVAVVCPEDHNALG